MRSLTQLTLGTFLALAGAVCATVPGHAWADGTGSLAPASGYAYATGGTATEREADGNLIVDYTNTGLAFGTFSGSYTEVGMVVYHADGSQTLHSTLTITGSAGSCGSGTVQFRVAASGTGGALAGTIITVDQTGDSVPVHAELSFSQASLFSPVFYSGTYHC